MPSQGPAGWVETADLFIAHWTGVNAALATPLTVGGYALADLQTDRDALDDWMETIQDNLNEVEGLRVDRDNLRDTLRERIRQFNYTVRGIFPTSRPPRQVPIIIRERADRGKWANALDDVDGVWAEIDTTPPTGFVPPLLLVGGYTRANFGTDSTALLDVLQDQGMADIALSESRRKRDALWEDMKAHLVAYRNAVHGAFPDEDPKILTLPRLTPLPGHTPDPVVLSGSWNAGTAKVDLLWTASDDVDLKEYQVRFCSGETYDTAVEAALATVAEGTLAYSDAGLTAPGGKRSYKVYVVLDTGNERGSNAVTVQNTTMAPPPGP